MLMMQLAINVSSTYSIEGKNLIQTSTVGTDCISNDTFEDGYKTYSTVNTNTCTRSEDYVYAAMPTEDAISLMIVVSDWRNAWLGARTSGQLDVGMTSANPASDPSKAASEARWISLGTKTHSQKLDLNANPIWGKYLMFKFECSSASCYQTTIYYVQMSSNQQDPSTTWKTNSVHP